MDHTNHVRLTAAEINSATLAGVTVYGMDDANLGAISHVHGAGRESEVIVDVGGFLGIGTKPVALRASQLDLMRDGDGEVHAVTAFTEEQLKQMPEHKEPDGGAPWPAS
ncbi:MAG TPA: PRC-barrel domain-containing protein [Mesorhizobium sp.]|jgi:hypothetical protein|uniref:PRC-barrel domain-containing protein n=1 Tax=Mesorhizobium sp. TaxID=1871066 RepID=UPI002DDD1723|nr:PRC-barrel domain-containing protein [Mesorhizobium sp.]HEV2502724.1 PRC-barrel domain-containing protein [Mesorhizobium sp.]